MGVKPGDLHRAKTVIVVPEAQSAKIISAPGPEVAVTLEPQAMIDAAGHGHPVSAHLDSRREPVVGVPQA